MAVFKYYCYFTIRLTKLTYTKGGETKQQVKRPKISVIIICFLQVFGDAKSLPVFLSNVKLSVLTVFILL